jgi:hypothetical protein
MRPNQLASFFSIPNLFETRDPRRRGGHWQFSGADRWLLTAILSVAIASGVSAQNVSFPGAKSETKSPDGRYMIRNSDSMTENPAHTLTLVESEGGSVVKVYQYRRSADVLWSPASDAFVINDYEGSDSTRPALYKVPWTGTKTDILEQLTAFLRSRHEENLFSTTTISISQCDAGSIATSSFADLKHTELQVPTGPDSRGTTFMGSVMASACTTRKSRLIDRGCGPSLRVKSRIQRANPLARTNLFSCALCLRKTPFFPGLATTSFAVSLR